MSDLGPIRLKNIAEPVRVYSLQVGKTVRGRPANLAVPKRRSTFVLLVAGIIALTMIAGGAWYFLRGPPVRGMTDNEIRFGISAPFTGSASELGNQMKLGIETAFNLINDGGGINGRQLRLVAADDGYEPSRTAETMKQLYENQQVFGFIGNVGTPTAVVAVPYGMGATENAVSATITRQLSKNTRLTLKYGFSDYRDTTSGGHNNYRAHSLFSSLQVRF